MKIITGNIFKSDCQTIVNTVNTVGVMGAGIALEFRLRYPAMFKRYTELCKIKQLGIGKLWLYKHNDNQWVLNFPTKKDWKHPSQYRYIELGLEKFCHTWEEKGIQSIAFPIMGGENGGLDKDKTLAIMEKYLSQCHLPVEIYHFDPMAKDDLFDQLSSFLINTSVNHVKSATGIRVHTLNLIIESINNQAINSVSRLISVKGVGIQSLEKLFAYLCQSEASNAEQMSLIN